MNGYCERHNQPWDIKCVNGEWVCECPKCRAEGLLDTYYDTKTTMLIEQNGQPVITLKGANDAINDRRNDYA